MYSINDLRASNEYFKIRKISKNLGLAFAVDLYNLLINKRYGYNFDFDVFLPTKGVDLQRPFVWTLEQQEELIWSLLFERTIPNLTFVIHEHQEWQVIDGKQRLYTIFRFMKGLFPIHFNNKEIYWNDLDKIAQHMIASPRIYYDAYYSYNDDPISDDEKIILFNQINFSGTPQDSDHIKKLLELKTK